MRSVMVLIVLASSLVGCSTPAATPIIGAPRTPISSTTVPPWTTTPASPAPSSTPTALPMPMPSKLPAWQIPSGLSYTSDSQLFTVNLTDGSSTTHEAAPPHGSIRSSDGSWYWITDEGILASSTDGAASELLLSWTVFSAEFPPYAWISPQYTGLETTLTMHQDQTAVLFNIYEQTPGGYACAVFALTIATRVATLLDLDCGATFHNPTAPVVAPNGIHAIANRRNMPDPPGIWMESTFLYTQHLHDGGRLLNPAGLLDAAWLADGRFIYSVDKGSPSFLPEMAAAAQRISIADQQGITFQTLATDVAAFQLALSPDQQHLAYITSDYDMAMPYAGRTAAPRELWVVALDGGAPRKLATLPGTADNLVWYP